MHFLKRVRGPVRVIAAAAIAVGWTGDLGHARADAAAPPVNLSVEQVPLDPNDPKVQTVGRLRYRGGVTLRSTDSRFGGLSSLLVLANGRTFLSASDRGHWVSGTIGYDGNGNLNDISGVSIVPLLGPEGQWLTVRPWRDAESLTQWRDGGLIVSFEDAHRLWAYPGRTQQPTRLEPPPKLNRAPRNGGIEALTTLPGARLFALSERLEDEDSVIGWIGAPGGRWWIFNYAVDGGYRPTGATTLPDGSVLVLERRFPPIGVRLRRIPDSALELLVLESDPLVTPELVGTFSPEMTMDNMEGVDARQTEDGRVLVYMVSDDNFNLLQRTLMMMFELGPAKPGEGRPDTAPPDLDD